MPLNDILKFFAKYIESELGIIYADHNYFQLQNRLEEIAKLLNVQSIELLYDQAINGIFGPFRQLLLDLATNNETSFFRDAKVFKAIEQALLADSHNQTLRIWSAASSGGQEALSTAMTIDEYNEKHNSFIHYSIFGSDISERILNKAKTGIYSQLEVQRGLPMPLLIKYFQKDSQDLWQAKPNLMQKIEYKKQNLKDPFWFREKFDLVLCRNVLIYQNVEGKTEILNRITATLKDGGYLILGSGESLLGISNDYEQRNIDGAIVYKKKAA